ncbi:serine hydrolase domain-containing protein [Micromonospora siamensis]|uniref:CubicO group peptidase, beta-lactamase class C family n=1 Tax=Micromonospora siamensis TaxID=299152 RepID=A0A1C5HEW9_9ACTN|nr:serine hydrolase domain-containing protein [Micromonospora siamensis]SCG44524.1 CubicO group peptidase, beta-lactamase class C family [Micromonospora siamensis]
MNADELLAVLEAGMAAHRVPGAQLVVHQGGKTTEAFAGTADAGTGEPVTSRTLFPFGSVTKPFTATLIAQLVDEGDLDLDSKVLEHLPELRAATAPQWRSLTLRHLLSHTGGLVADHDLGERGSRSLRRFVAGCRDLEFVAEPGTRFSYSNTGYILAGRCVEAVTGYPWWEALDSFLARPLGLGLADLTTPGPGPGPVSGHGVSGERVWPVPVELPTTWAPAGGVLGSAADLVAFALLHVDPATAGAGLLSPAAGHLLREPVPAAEPFGLADRWGSGWAIFRNGWIGHDGTLDGAVCHVRAHPPTTSVIAYVANATSGDALWTDLTVAVSALGLDVAAAEMSIANVEIPFTDLEQYEDVYVNGRTRLTVQAAEGGRLRIADAGGFKATLIGCGSDQFAVRRVDSTEVPHLGRFLRDDAGRVTALQLSGRLALARRAACSF